MRVKKPDAGCVTDGENGVWYLQGNAIENIPAFKVNAIDTIEQVMSGTAFSRYVLGKGRLKLTRSKRRMPRRR